jgi:hypothetical protein
MPKQEYQRFVIGYHGCDAEIAAKVLAGKARLRPSTNAYDWLGKGIYFWEHGPQRALEWAIEQKKVSGAKVGNPAVLGAKIDLGLCFDLLDTRSTRLLTERYLQFRRFVLCNRYRMPRNLDAPGTRRGDKVLRYRDRAVIDYTLKRLAQTEGIIHQSVRGVFVEGGPAFPGSKIMLKSHIQVAIRDYTCILELFQTDPREFPQAGGQT